MKVTLNRQLIGLEDIAFGEGVVEQIRGGETAEITKINAANLPFDEINTLKEVLDNLNLDAIGSSLPAIDRIHESIGNVDRIGTELLATDNIELLGADLALGVNSDIRKVIALEPKMDYTKNTLEAKMDYIKNTLEAKLDYADATLEPKMDYTKNTLEAKMDYTDATLEPKMDYTKNTLEPKIDTVITNLTDINNAEENALLAKNYANEDEDVEVETGLYSAKHWTLKAQDLVTNGVIDDDEISELKTYSSSKIESELLERDTSIRGIILENTDINTIKTGGRYGIIGSGNTNTPIASECYMEVLADADGRVMQMLYYPTGEHYSRIFGTFWLGWFKHNTKSNVGLGNVDNTSDVNKPISTATQTALNGKVSLSSAETISGVKTFTAQPIGIAKASVGLGNVTNDAQVKATTSTDNAVVRFDGTTGQVQNSNVVIDDSGNVQTSSNGHKSITVKTTQDSYNADLIAESTTGRAGIRLKANAGNYWNIGEIGTGNFVICNNANGNMATNERMRIDSSGNVGIGTSSPSNLLHIEASSNPRISILDTGTKHFSIGCSGPNFTLFDESSVAERMRIDSSGNLLVGTTTDNGVDKLQVNGSIKSEDRQKFSGTIDGNASVSFNVGRNVCCVIQYRTSHNVGDARAFIGMINNNWTNTNITQIALNDLGSTSVSHSVTNSTYDGIFTITNTSSASMDYALIISSTATFYKL